MPRCRPTTLVREERPLAPPLRAVRPLPRLKKMPELKGWSVRRLRWPSERLHAMPHGKHGYRRQRWKRCARLAASAIVQFRPYFVLRNSDVWVNRDYRLRCVGIDGSRFELESNHQASRVLESTRLGAF